MKTPTTVSRRFFLKAGTAAGGGLLISLYAPELVKDAAAQAGSFSPNIWVRIAPDDTVTVMLTQIEMGQGTMTAMPMLLAEDLDADLAKIKVEWVGADRRYANPNNRVQSTAASQSTRGYWRPMREAGAAARAMLVTAAAQTWSVPEQSLTTEKGIVTHAASGRTLRYGELVSKAAAVPVPERVTIKSPNAFRIMGKNTPRVDIPSKVNGTAQFGLDVKLPNMLIARILRTPVPGGKVASINDARAKAVPGVRHVVHVKQADTGEGVAVVADNFWAATKGIQALEVKWDEGPRANFSTELMWRQMAEIAEQSGIAGRNDGDFDAAWATAPKKVDAVYQVPYLAHAPMEPMNCIADVRPDGCDIWAPTQGQTAAHEAGVEVSGLPEDKVKVHPSFLGGGFGRRSEKDFVEEAVEVSKAIGRPVKVIWSREDDIQHNPYRPAVYVHYWAALDQAGNPIGWKAKLVQSNIFARRPRPGANAGPLGAGTAMGGIIPLAYRVPNRKTEYGGYEPGVRVGFWRAPSGSITGYMADSFIDELAGAAGKDPYRYRRDLITDDRLLGVLDLVAEKAGWGTPLPAGRFRGISVGETIGSYAAHVAEISVANDGKVRVHRVVCAADVGWTINPDTIHAQIEGGIIYALSALNGEITLQNGRVTQSNFHNYPMVRMSEAPVVEGHIVPSTQNPGGVGEISTPGMFSAVTNAIFAATGKRIRKLPIRAEELRRA